MTVLVVIAKECLPGRVKTRLHPPLSLEQAAMVAAASLDDTLGNLAELPASRRVLAFDGENPPQSAAGYEILPQVTGGLDGRLAAVFDAFDEPVLLIGMDTPQVSADALMPVFTDWKQDIDAWFGFAADGGFWAMAMSAPNGALIRGVPMSRADTGQIQFERLEKAGLRVRRLPTLTDVDTVEDAHAVASRVPDGRFAAVLAAATTPKETLR